MPKPPLRGRDQGVVLKGFEEIQRALQTIDRDTRKELRKRLRIVGKDVAVVARKNVRHKDGRHGNDGPHLSESVKVSVGARNASVYSTAVHGGVQNVGGKVGRGQATLLKRADVSAYMNRAVTSEKDHVAKEMDSLLDWLTDTFNKGGR